MFCIVQVHGLVKSNKNSRTDREKYIKHKLQHRVQTGNYI